MVGFDACPVEVLARICKHFDDVRPVIRLSSTCKFLHDKVFKDKKCLMVKAAAGDNYTVFDDFDRDLSYIDKVIKHAKALQLIDSPIPIALEDDVELSSKDGDFQIRRPALNSIPPEFGDRIAVYGDSNPIRETGPMNDGYERGGSRFHGFVVVDGMGTEQIFDYTIDIKTKKLKVGLAFQRPLAENWLTKSVHNSYSMPKIVKKGRLVDKWRLIDIFESDDHADLSRVLIFMEAPGPNGPKPRPEKFLVVKINDQGKVVHNTVVEEGLGTVNCTFKICWCDPYIVVLLGGGRQYIQVLDMDGRDVCSERKLPSKIGGHNIATTRTHVWFLDECSVLYSISIKDLIAPESAVHPPWKKLTIARTRWLYNLTGKHFYDKFITFVERGQLVVYDFVHQSLDYYVLHKLRDTSELGGPLEDSFYNDIGGGKWLVSDRGKVIYFQRIYLQQVCTKYLHQMLKNRLEPGSWISLDEVSDTLLEEIGVPKGFVTESPFEEPPRRRGKCPMPPLRQESLHWLYHNSKEIIRLGKTGQWEALKRIVGAESMEQAKERLDMVTVMSKYKKFEDSFTTLMQMSSKWPNSPVTVAAAYMV